MVQKYSHTSDHLVLLDLRKTQTAELPKIKWVPVNRQRMRYCRISVAAIWHACLPKLAPLSSTERWPVIDMIKMYLPSWFSISRITQRSLTNCAIGTFSHLVSLLHHHLQRSVLHTLATPPFTPAFPFLCKLVCSHQTLSLATAARHVNVSAWTFHLQQLKKAYKDTLRPIQSTIIISTTSWNASIVAPDTRIMHPATHA